MLADMVPARSALFGYAFNTTGVTLGTLGILLGSNTLFHAAVSFLLIGSVFVVKDIFYMINFKG